jgi:hypothetical protein
MAPSLDDLLDQTSAALLSGDLTALARLSPLVETAASELPRDPAALARLKAKADRNSRLIAAAARGVRAARTRLGEIVRGPVLNTYDAQGRRESVGPIPSGQVRRA